MSFTSKVHIPQNINMFSLLNDNKAKRRKSLIQSTENYTTIIESDVRRSENKSRDPMLHGSFNQQVSSGEETRQYSPDVLSSPLKKLK